MSKIFFLFLLTLVSAFSDAQGFGRQHAEKAPFAAFIMIHLEVGGDNNFKVFQTILKKELKSEYQIDNRSLDYQKALWPTVKELVHEADLYNFKLTLALNPQWAEYILQDAQKIEDIRKWVHNGHEVAFHHHGINHIDWNGYSNQSRNEHDPSRQRFIDKLNSGRFRGNADEGFGWLKKLARKISPDYRIMTGNVTDTANDKPIEVIIVSKGSDDFDKDFIGKPSRQQLPGGQTIFWIRHYLFRSNFNPGSTPDLYDESQTRAKAEQELERIKRNYANAGHNEVVGVVFHEFDYYRQPEIYKAFFKYLASNNQRVTTIRSLVKNYIDEFSMEGLPPEQPEHPQRRMPPKRF